jgi:hypothetical protein
MNQYDAIKQLTVSAVKEGLTWLTLRQIPLGIIGLGSVSRTHLDLEKVNACRCFR